MEKTKIITLEANGFLNIPEMIRKEAKNKMIYSISHIFSDEFQKPWNIILITGDLVENKKNEIIGIYEWHFQDLTSRIKEKTEGKKILSISREHAIGDHCLWTALIAIEIEAKK
jgi:hypothetical protein